MRKIGLLLCFGLSSFLVTAQNWSTSPSNSSNIYYNSGNVGIGTDAPQAGLHVNSATPITSSGMGAGFRLKDLSTDFQSSDNDWTWYSRNGLLYLLKGSLGVDVNGKPMGSGHAGNRFQISPNGDFNAYGGVTVNGPYVGPGNLNLWAQEGETASGTAYIKAWTYQAGQSIDLQLSTIAPVSTNPGHRVDVMRLTSSGNVGIGTTNPGAYRLAVNGTIGAKEVKVTATGWADFVFSPAYSLPRLPDVEAYIRQHGHLPNIPSETEVVQNGISLGEIQTKLLQKVEELTLYVINQQKEIKRLRRRVSKLDTLHALMKPSKNSTR